MIVRTSFRCTTCGQNHTVRIGVGHETYQSHTFHCSGCGEELTVGLRVSKPEGSPIPQFNGEPVENVEQSEEEADAVIVKVDANFLIPLEERHQGCVFSAARPNAGNDEGRGRARLARVRQGFP